MRLNCVLIAIVSAPFIIGSVNAAENSVQITTTPKGVEYGLWGQSKGPAPVLFVLAGTIESTLTKPYFRQCGNQLSEHGFICVSVDLPCHGKEIVDGIRSGLIGWSELAQRGENFVADSNRRLSNVLDHLIEAGIADPNRIAACGTSRGGFLAIHFMAADPRVKCAAGFAPVTDLKALGEFTQLQNDQFVESLSLSNHADQLAGRPVWIVIGDQDERVSTQKAIELGRNISKSSNKQELVSQVALHVLAEPKGHTTPAGSQELATNWFLQHIRPVKKAKSAETRHLLFVDDHHVLYRSGTKRVFHPATNHSDNPIIREDKPWEMAIGWTSVLRHPETGKYQLWYQAYAGGRDDRKTHKCVVCYAESDDGIRFTKPELTVHNFQTEREPYAGLYDSTNIVLIGDGGYGDRYANSVLCEPREPDESKRYKMLYTDFSTDESGQEWPGFHAAFSPDGIHWTKAPQNPLNRTAYGGRGLQPAMAGSRVTTEVWDQRKNFLRKTWAIPLSMSDAADVIYDPIRDEYAAYGKVWIQGPDGGLAWKHAMARVRSDDFINWSFPEIIASPDDEDAPNTEFHTSPVFYHKGCYFCLNQILSARGEAIGAKADAMHIELMISRDGVRWERPFRDTPFIANSEQAFSNGGIFTNSTPVILDDAIRFYYGGYNSGAIGGGAKLSDPSQQSGVGFASIPLDRFAGIRPVKESAQSTLKRPLQNVGQVTLKPMSLDNIKAITLNADAREGSIRVEILDTHGYRIPGFTKDDAIPISGDSFNLPIGWKGKRLSDLPVAEYLVRIHMDNSELFAITLNGE